MATVTGQDQLNSIKKQCGKHPEEQVQAVCMKLDCKFNSKLICKRCLASEHSQHGDQFILTDDIEQGKSFFENWPKMQELQYIKDNYYIEQQLDDEQYLESLFNQFEKKLIQKIRLIKAELKGQLEQFSQSRKQLLKAIDEQFRLIVQPETLKQILRNETSSDDGSLDKKLNEYCKETERLARTSPVHQKFLNRVNKVSLTFNQGEFLQAQQNIFDSLTQFRKCLIPRQFENKLFFVRPVDEKKAQLKLQQDWYKLNTGAQGGSIMIYSQILEQEESYELTLVGNSINDELFVGILEDQFKSNDINVNSLQSPAIKVTGEEFISCLIKKDSNFSISDALKKKQGMIKFICQIKNNLFKVYLQNQIVYDLTADFNFKNGNWRFFLFSNTKQQLQQSVDLKLAF